MMMKEGMGDAGNRWRGADHAKHEGREGILLETEFVCQARI